MLSPAWGSRPAPPLLRPSDEAEAAPAPEVDAAPGWRTRRPPLPEAEVVHVVRLEVLFGLLGLSRGLFFHLGAGRSLYFPKNM